MSERWRLFTGILLPNETRALVVSAQADLRALDLPARWIKAENLHITLHFFGDVDAEAVPALTAALERELAGCRAPAMRCATLGAFPTMRRPRVLWAGMAAVPPELPPILAATERGGMTVGVPPKTQPFTPHITLGYAKDQSAASSATAWAQAFQKVAPPADQLRAYPQVALIRSILSRGGSIYTLLATWNLAADEPPTSI